MVEQFKAWWESITSREQQMALVSAATLVVAILYWGIWTPMNNRLLDSERQLHSAEQTLSWTQEKATLLLKSGIGSSKTKRVNLTQVLNRSAQKNGITFSRIVNKEDQIEVWINDVEFDLFVRWLTQLSNEDGVSVINVDLAKTDLTGYIKVNRLLLGQ